MGSRLYRIRRRRSILVLSKALEANNGQKMAKPSGLLREIDQKCLKRRRMRCRRVHVYSTDPRRPQGDLFGRDDRIKTGAAAIDRGAPSAANKKNC